MKINMMRQSIKRKYAYFGSRDNVRMEIAAHFCMRILKKSYPSANILKNRDNALKVINACTDILTQCLRIQMAITKNTIRLMDSFLAMKRALTLTGASATKVMNADLLILISSVNYRLSEYKFAKIINLDSVLMGLIANRNT